MKNYNFNRLFSVFTAFVFLFTSIIPVQSFASVNSREKDSKNIQTIKSAVPKSAGYITDYSVTPGSNILVYIQDLHCNPGAQKSISKIIASLDKELGVEKIILEGVPEGKIESNVIAALPETVKYPVVEKLLERGLLTGVELYSVENDNNNIYGLENWDKYIENLYRAAELIKNKDNVLGKIRSFEKAVNTNSKKSINGIKELISLKRDNNWYKQLKKSEFAYSENFSDYSNLANYLELRELNKDLNFKRVQKELEKFTSVLKNTLPYKEYSDLTAKSDNHPEYFEAMHKIAEKAGIEAFAAEYPNLYLFLDYSVKSDKVNPILVFYDEESYIKRIIDEESAKRGNFEDILIFQMTSMLGNYFSLSMTDAEFNFFLSNLSLYKSLIRKHYPAYREVSAYLDNAEYLNYYVLNIQRNDVFLSNLTKYAAETKNGSVSVFVSGGFHTSLIDDLKENGISYVLVTPVVSQDFDSVKVYNRFMEINSSVPRVLRNALNPIPLMLAAISGIPAANREVYVKELINTIIETSPQNYQSPEILQPVIEEWARNTSGMDAFEVFYDKDFFTVKIKEQTLKFGITNGKIDFGNGQLFVPESKEYAPIRASLEQIGYSFRYAAMGSTAGYAAKTLAGKIVNHASSMVVARGNNFSSFSSKREDAFFFSYLNILNFIAHSRIFNNKLLRGLSARARRNSLTIVAAIADRHIRQNDARQILIPFEDDGTFVEVIIENSLANILSSSAAELPAVIKDLFLSSKEGNSLKDFPKLIYIATLNKAPFLFENFTGLGFIGVNEALFDIVKERTSEEKESLAELLSSMMLRKDEIAEKRSHVLYELLAIDNEEDLKRKALIQKTFLKAGIMHELAHEFNPGLSGKDLEFFETKRMMDDINYIINEVKQVYGYDFFDGETLNEESYNDEIRDTIILPYISDILGRSQIFHAFDNYKTSLDEYISYIKRAEDVSDALLKHIEETYFVTTSKAKIDKTDKKTLEENERHFFSSVVLTKEEIAAREGTLSGFLANKADRVKKNEVTAKVGALALQFRTILTSADEYSNSDIKSKVATLEASFISGLEVLYKTLPEHFFRRFFEDNTMIDDHDLSHSMEVIKYMLEILSKEKDKLRELTESDIKMMVYGALMHDVTCIVARNEHEANSALMVKKIFESYPDPDINVNLLAKITAGHKKVPNKSSPRDIHKDSYIACMLHDADTLSAVMDFERLYKMKKKLEVKDGTVMYDKTISKQKRIQLIKDNKYLPIDGADALNDFLRQFLRRDANLFLTEGAGIIVNAASNENALYSFFEQKKADLKNKYSEADITKMMKDMKEVLDYFMSRHPQSSEEFRDAVSAYTGKNIRYILKQMWREYRGENANYFMNVAVSDVHGGYKKLSQVISEVLGDGFSFDQDNAIDEIEQALRDSAVNALYVLGDMVDRGGGMLKTMDFVMNAFKSGKMRYVIGNHDLYCLMNLFGLHLPFYKHYNGIDGEYTDIYGNVKKLHREKIEQDEALHVQSKNVTFIGSAKKLRKSNGATDKIAWAKGLSRYMDISKVNQKKVWDGELARAASLFEDAYGLEYKLDMKGGKDVLNKPSGRFKGPQGSNEERLRSWWASVLGHNVGVMVYTGLRAADKMSINWWKDKLTELDEMYEDGLFPSAKEQETYARMREMLTLIIDSQTARMIAENGRDLEGRSVTPRQAWAQFAQQQRSMTRDESTVLLFEKIISNERERLIQTGAEADKVQDNWMWRVLDAIMYRNYESTEWQAMDWSFHNAWGAGEDGLIAQRNREIEEKFRAENAIAPGAELSDEQQTMLNSMLLSSFSYLNDSRLKSFLKFFKENFYLYRRDEYGTYYMHSMLPVDDDGNIAIGKFENGRVITKNPDGSRFKGLDYKGKHYEGKSIFKGLDAIGADIRNFDLENGDLSQIYEALALITSIYADATTAIKPFDLLNTHQKIGFSKIFDKAGDGMVRIVVGHNPLDGYEKTGLHQIEFFGNRYLQTIIAADDSFSPAYAKPDGKGSAIIMSGEIGVVSTGFESGQPDALMLTRTLMKKNQFIKSLFFGYNRRIAVMAFAVYEFFTGNILNLFDTFKNGLFFKKHKKLNDKNTIVVNMIRDRADDNKAKMKFLTGKGISTIGIELSRVSEGVSEKLLLEQKKDNSVDVLILVTPDGSKKEIKLPISFRHRRVKDIDTMLDYIEVYVGYEARKILQAEGITFESIKDRILASATAVFIEKMQEKNNVFEKFIRQVHHNKKVVLRTAHFRRFQYALTDRQKYAMGNVLIADSSPNAAEGTTNERFDSVFESTMYSAYENLTYYDFLKPPAYDSSSPDALTDKKLDSYILSNILTAA